MMKRSEVINEAVWQPVPGDMIRIRIVELEKKSVDALTFKDEEFLYDDERPSLSALDDFTYTVVKHSKGTVRDDFGLIDGKTREQVLLVTPRGIGWYEFNRRIFQKVNP